MTWNWRLYKETVKDDFGRELERISFIEVYYDKDGRPNGVGTEFNVAKALEQFSELDYPDDTDEMLLTTDDLKKLPYKPINKSEAVDSIRFTLNKLIEATDKVMLTPEDFKKDTK